MASAPPVGVVFALAAAFGAAFLPTGVVAPAGAPAEPASLTAQVGSVPMGPAMAPGYVGVSLEYRALHVYAGRDPTAINPVLVALMRGLAPGQAPVLRIGGDSTDETWWPTRGVIPPGGVSYRLTNGWLRTTRALAATLGAKLIMGVNLAAGRPALAAAEARALLRGIGRKYIDALEIGNEPDLYGVFAWFRDRRHRVVRARGRRYDLRHLIADAARWRAAIPRARLAGPAFSSLAWMGGLGRFTASEPSLAMVTFHRYPLRGCLQDPASPSFASIPNLLADAASSGLAAGVAPYVRIAHARGLPFRLDELDSASCSGRRGVSDTFAAALWELDTLFSMAAVGVDGVNLHTLPGAPYEPFTFAHDATGWHAFVHPDHYGAMLFARAFPPGARLLPVTAASGPVKVWATRGPDGAVRVVLINKQAGTPMQVKMQLPGVSTAATAQTLTAPGLKATHGVTLAGQTFGDRTDTGRLAGQPRRARIDPVAGTYSVSVPAGSAVLVAR
jgi:hypothetical protein